VVTVCITGLPSTDWGDLFDAVKDEVDNGASTFVFPRDLSHLSTAGMDVFHALIQYLAGTGATVLREGTEDS
jgi:hypothetical protein